MVGGFLIFLFASVSPGEENDFLRPEKAVLLCATSIYGLLELIGNMNPSAYLVQPGNIILTIGLFAASIAFYRLIKAHLTHELPHFGWGVEE
jgi:hypothetical protein